MTVTLQLSPADDRSAAAAVAEFQSQTAEILASDLAVGARATLWAIAGMVVIAILLAAVLPIDRVVTARGRVTSVQPKIVVQPLETSIVRRLHVREGQIVHAGDPLVTLDPTFSNAAVDRLELRMSALGAELRRLEAELADAPFAAQSNHPAEILQENLWASRRAQWDAMVAGYAEKIAAARSSEVRAEREIAFYRERLSLIREIETMRTTLQEKQTGSRLNVIVASDQRVEIERNVAVQTSTLDQARHQIEGLRADREAALRRWNADVAEQIADRRQQLSAAREEMAKAGKRRELVELRAVQDAVVLQMGDVSVGSVIESAKKIFVLVPLDGGLQAEVEVAGNDQGWVKPGQAVVLKLDAWPYSRHGTVRGTVRTVSADSFRPQGAEAPGPAVYLAHVDIGEADLHGVPADFRLVPGMPLAADVAVGSRTPLGYLLDKVIPLSSEGLREP